MPYPVNILISLKCPYSEVQSLDVDLLQGLVLLISTNPCSAMWPFSFPRYLMVRPSSPFPRALFTGKDVSRVSDPPFLPVLYKGFVGCPSKWRAAQILLGSGMWVVQEWLGNHQENEWYKWHGQRHSSREEGARAMVFPGKPCLEDCWSWIMSVLKMVFYISSLCVWNVGQLSRHFSYSSAVS